MPEIYLLLIKKTHDSIESLYNVALKHNISKPQKCQVFCTNKASNGKETMQIS